MIMKQIILVILGLAVSSLIYAEDAIQITNGEYPPFLSENLKYYGAGSHIVTEAFKLEGIKVKYGFFPWKRSFNLAQRGEWDGTILWVKNQEREKNFYISDPVISGIYVFFHLKDYPFDWSTIDDLQNLEIGGTIGYHYGDAFEKAETEKKFNVQRVPEDEQNFRKLLKHRIQLFAVGLDAGYDLLRKHYDSNTIQLFTYHPKPLKEVTSHLLLSKKVKKNQRLILLFNQGLKKLKESGKYKQFFEASRKGEYLLN